MSLLFETKGASFPVPKLEGKEILVGPDPGVCKVKGVMFGGRKQFLTDIGGAERLAKLATTLSPRTAQYIRMPMASAWCEFESLIELDRAVHEDFKPDFPNILALIGAASAELGIGKVYRVLDSEELAKFFETNALFHDQFQKFGRVKYEKTPNGGRMIYSGYPCYSPVYCASAVGYFFESILRHGGKEPVVHETRCQTMGDSSCTFEMNWSS